MSRNNSYIPGLRPRVGNGLPGRPQRAVTAGEVGPVNGNLFFEPQGADFVRMGQAVPRAANPKLSELFPLGAWPQPFNADVRTVSLSGQGVTASVQAYKLSARPDGNQLVFAGSEIGTVVTLTKNSSDNFAVFTKVVAASPLGSGSPLSVSYSPDGKYLFVLLPGTGIGRLRVFEVSGNTLVEAPLVATPENLTTASNWGLLSAFVRDGLWYVLLHRGWDGFSVYAFDGTAFSLVTSVSGEMYGFDMSTDGKFIAARRQSITGHYLWIFNGATYVQTVFGAESTASVSYRFSQDGRRLYAFSSEAPYYVTAFDVTAAGLANQRTVTHPSSITGLVPLAGDGVLVTGAAGTGAANGGRVYQLTETALSAVNQGLPYSFPQGVVASPRNAAHVFSVNTSSTVYYAGDPKKITLEMSPFYCLKLG